MNLFYKPSLSELAVLVEQNTENCSNYNVIVDFDGEVLIDSNANLSRDTLDKFKFYFKVANEGQPLGHPTARYLKYINQLYKNLIFCWEEDINGRVDYERISKIQNRLIHKEARELSERAYPINVSTTF